MAEQIHQGLSFKDNTKQLMRLLKRFKGLVTFIVLFGIGVSLSEGFGVTIVVPLLEGVGGSEISSLPFPFSLISSYFSGMGFKERIQSIAVIMVVIVSFKSFLTYMSSILINRLQQNSIKYYRLLCFNQLLKLKMGYFNLQRLGHIQSLITTRINHVGVLIASGASIISSIFTIALLIIMLFVLSWKMTLLALFLVGLSSFILRGISRKSADAGEASDAAVQNMSTTLLDTLTGMKIIHLFNRQKDIISKFKEDAENYRDTVFRLVRAKDMVKPLFEFTGVASLALVMFAGSFILGNYGKDSMQVLLLFLFIFFRIMPAANAFNSMRVSIIGYWPFLKRTHEFIQKKENLYIKDGSKTFKGLKQSIQMKGLNFSYNSSEKEVLHNISFDISKGLKVGVVGPSGGGKSTLVELLLRFYDPQAGEVLVDGIDLREFEVNSWRRHIGVVSQDTFLFNDTVWANIAFAKPGASEEEIRKAAKRAHAYDFIKELPLGYDTMLGERGVRLSGGQRQRIAIARAILAEPEILVFDEATSSLDTASEWEVQAALDEISLGKTVISIAHRLSTVAGTDKIIVIDKGRIVQQGAHQELLRQEGTYKKLVQLQALGNEHR
ncbi:MAG: ABC transporter ATP-binding protein [Candidatus Omnitrophica bacterium]|nr:ABC transporter ATP-binding protein [Candidatus Omnitrophota bacterium]MDD5429913.1 ABC transporter ATP-binding protein [Candidatus Omnitrophota bacterium]